jgi:hypothetical protein
VSIELRMLTLSVVLSIVQIVAASHAASLQRGYQWSASARDETEPPLQGVAGRLDRALHILSSRCVCAPLWNIATIGIVLIVVALFSR